MRHKPRHFSSSRARQLACLVLACVFLAVGQQQAVAQESPLGRVFQNLFGNKNERAREARPKQTKRSTKRKRRAPRQADSYSVAGKKKTNAVEKSADARKIMVIGDFLAGGLAEGLTTAFEENANVVIVNRANGSSGIVRDDYYNWRTELGPLIDAEKPAIIVMMIGSNDRQTMRALTKSMSPRSPEWDKEYQRRIAALVNIISAQNIGLVWVGMPAFKRSSMTADMLAFNDMYKTAVERVNGDFVDIWDGFVDENGTFVTTGPDINGQPVRLRGSDGINVTRAGRRKVAFYAEKPLKRLLGEPTGPGIVWQGVDPLTGTPQGPPPSPVIVDRTMPVSLIDPPADTATELLGRRPVARNLDTKTMTSAQRLLVEGKAPRPTLGRADDFSTAPAKPDVSVPSQSPSSEKTSAVNP